MSGLGRQFKNIVRPSSEEKHKGGGGGGDKKGLIARMHVLCGSTSIVSRVMGVAHEFLF